MNVHVVSVRALAEWACARGGIMQAAGARRLREGREGHEAIQSLFPSGWRIEAPVSMDVPFENVILRIQGRADALLMEAGRICVTEIKTTRCNPNEILELDYPEHWAQAEIYAYLFSFAEPAEEIEARLIYAGTRGGRREFVHRFDREEIKCAFLRYAEPYASWVATMDQWKDQSAPTQQKLKFPFDDYREGQRDMAKYIYTAMKRGTRTLIEAPTGIGKTAASLFGALKALGEGRITCIFYLTARTTGRRAAENAVELMRARGLSARTVTLTAKEKICFPGNCDCALCAYGTDYYARRGAALRQAMQEERFPAERIEELAREHELCPFELSLDISELADVIICDYNYVFDPRVRLKRYFDRKNRVGLLIDEAHNLPDRAREMYSAALNGEAIEKIRNQNRAAYGDDDPLGEVMDVLILALTEEDAEYDARRDVPDSLVRAAEAFSELADKLHPSDEPTKQLAQDCAWFARVAHNFDEDCYRLMIRPVGDRIEARLWCFNPVKYIDRTFARVGGVGLFSATLRPMDFYGNLLAVPDRNAHLELPSPFPEENLLTLRLPVSVKFRDREQSLEAVARAIHAMAQAHAGNYMACFPSYAYLNQTYKYYRMRFSGERVICQSSGMNEARREEFIRAFERSPATSMIAFVVLGGVFSEGVDLPDDRLSGAAIVTTGVPQVNAESEMLRMLYDDGDEGGTDAAYTYPGFRRVLQAAGRVIRTETDRGVILLIDERYGTEKYLNLMPNHWHVRKVGSMSALNRRLRAFWGEPDAADERN